MAGNAGSNGQVHASDEGETCSICGKPAAGLAMRFGAHVLCSGWQLEHQRRLDRLAQRRGLLRVAGAPEP